MTAATAWDAVADLAVGDDVTVWQTPSTGENGWAARIVTPQTRRGYVVVDLLEGPRAGRTVYEREDLVLLRDEARIG